LITPEPIDSCPKSPKGKKREVKLPQGVKKGQKINTKRPARKDLTVCRKKKQKVSRRGRLRGKGERGGKEQDHKNPTNLSKVTHTDPNKRKKERTVGRSRSRVLH